MQSDRFQSSLAGTPHPTSNFSFLHSRMNDSFFFLSLFLSSQRENAVCVDFKKTKNTTAVFYFFLIFSFSLRGIKVEPIQLQLTKVRKTLSPSVRIWISDFVCRWFLLHVFKAGSQSRSTISVAPWRSYVWVDVSVCSMLSMLQANTKKDIYFTPFFFCNRKSFNINFQYQGLLDNWHLQRYSKASRRGATVAMAGDIDWNNQCLSSTSTARAGAFGKKGNLP